MMRRNVWTATIAMSAFLSGTVAWAEDVQVYFDSSSSKLSPKDAAAVKRIAKRAGEGQIKLRGSSDPRGSEELNSKLREERVRSVHDLLVSLGVPDSRIESDAGSGAEGPPSSYGKLRNVRISYEPSGAGKVAKAEPSETPTKAEPTGEPTPKMTAAQKRAEAAEAKRAAAEAKKAEAEAKRAEAAEAKKAAADAKKAEAEQKRAEAEAKKAEAAEGKRKAAAEMSAGKAGTEPKPAETASATPSKKGLEPINLIYWKSLNHALWIVAKEKGFFAQEGFDVTLKETDENARDVAKHVHGTVDEAGGVQSTKALEKGQKKFFAGAVCGFAVHEAMAHKEPVVDIGSMIMLPLTMVVPKDIAKKLQEDLHAFKSLRLAERTYGEGEHDFKYTNVLRGELEKVGLKEKTDYTLKEFDDTNAMLKKLESKDIDVAIVLPPEDVDFVRTHKDYVRIPFARFFPYLPCCRQLVTRSQLKNSRDRYVRLLRASIRAHEYIISHPRESAQIMSSYLKMPADTIRQSIMTSYVQLTPDPNRKGIELYQRTNDKATNTHTNTAEYVDTSLYRDALFSLSEEAKDDPARKGYYDTMKSRFRANN